MDKTQIVEIAASALMGAGGLGLFQYLFMTKKQRADAAVSLISSMQTHVNNLEKRLDGMQKELDAYKEKYFVLRQDHSEMKIKYAKLQQAHDTLKMDFHKLKNTTNE